MSLRAKLERLLPKELLSGEERVKSGNNLDVLLRGREVTTPYGSCYVVEKAFPLAREHGHWTLAQVASAGYGDFSALGPRLTSVLDLEKAIFLDTETTGLAGGTGTYAFLVGLGYFINDHFLVRQLLMRDFDEEWALLYLLEEELKGKDLIISFNGKTFDLPLLETRFILTRQGFQGSRGKEQLDLLHLARRVWRQKLDSCSLANLERQVLGVKRGHDIPGAEIPARYFEFLQTGNGALLPVILEHNVIDVVSMATLLYRLNSVEAQAPAECLCPFEAEALAREAHRSGEERLGLAYLERAHSLALEEKQQARILRSIAYSHKRLGEYALAHGCWQRLLALIPRDLTAHEELAKHLEHREKDWPEAENVTRRALALAKQHARDQAPAFEHRLARLLAKQAKQASPEGK